MVSNHFLSHLKRKYQDKKAGFSGTLDPFAQGVLIIAFGQFTKLFRFLKKAPKLYRATLWIGASSPTLDSEAIEKVEHVMPFHPDSINIVLKSMIGEISYIPPKYSAKHVNGERAYALARKQEAFELEAIKTEVYACELVHYCHPFLTFDVSLSEGGYVRSLGEMIAKKLGFSGSLSALERLKEGNFSYENETLLDPLDYIDLPTNTYCKEAEDIVLGRKLSKENFEIQEEGIYKILVNKETLSIIQISENEVQYLLNTILLKV